MKKAYEYFLVEPTQEKYVDNDSIEPLFITKVEIKKKIYEVALFSTQNRIYMLRIMIPNLENEVMPEEDVCHVQEIKEHMLSVLRITYSSKVSIFPISIRCFGEQGNPPGLSIDFKESINPDFKIDKQNILSTFIATSGVRHQIKLISDSQDRRIPLQYQYLSLYKLLELEFKQRGGWQEPEFSKFLSKFKDDFLKGGVTKKNLKNYIIELRDKCAHIKNKKEIFGVTELNAKSTIEIERFLPFLIYICTSLLNEKYKDRGFTLIRYPKYTIQKTG